MEMESACFNPRELELGEGPFLMGLDAHSPGFDSGSQLHFFPQDFEFGKPSPGSSAPPTNFFDATPFSSLQPEVLYNGDPLEILPELTHSSEGDTESSPPDTIKVESPIDPALTEKPKSPACTRARPTRGSSRTTRPPAKLRDDMDAPLVASEPPLSLSGKSGKPKKTSAKVEKPAKEGPPARKRSKRAITEQSPQLDEPENGEEDTREKFLARNRVAASKCRQKKKAYVDTLQEDLRELEDKYKNLKDQLQALVGEKALLKEAVMNHASCNDPNIQAWMQGEAGRIAMDQQARAQRDMKVLESSQVVLDSIQAAAGRTSFSTAGSVSRQGSISQASPIALGPTIDAFVVTSPSVKREEGDTNLNHMPDEIFTRLSSSGSDQI